MPPKAGAETQSSIHWVPLGPPLQLVSLPQSLSQAHSLWLHQGPFYRCLFLSSLFTCSLDPSSGNMICPQTSHWLAGDSHTFSPARPLPDHHVC